ncbi:hypothetical protein K525DRAFT_266159 [Schizophyllum commune Loenen D]|nr:hypothetical protein K525DRAFT_266159 [Schizophyllum commune Loenen D]
MGIAFSRNRPQSGCAPTPYDTSKHRDNINRRPLSLDSLGPIRTTPLCSQHRALPYPHTSPRRATVPAPLSLPGSSSRSGPAASSRPGPSTPLSSGSATRVRVVRFRDDSPASGSSYDASSSDDGWDMCRTPPQRLAWYDMDDGRPVQSIEEPASFRNNKRSSTAGRSCRPNSSSTVTNPPVHVFRDSSPDYEVLNPNTQGQAVWEIEDEESPPGGHGGAMAAMNEDGGFPREIPSTQVSARSIPQGSGSTSEGGHIPPRFSKQVNFSSSTTSQGKIPKPPGEPGRPSSGGYNLQEATRLEPSRFRTVRKEMNSLVRTHLDTERTFTKQTEECVAAYTEEALRRFPFLDDYEDHWPIRGFAVMHLHYLQNRAKSRSRDMH